MDLVEKLFAVIEKNGFLDKEAASLLGVTKVTISKWRNRHVSPHCKVVRDIEKFIRKYG